MMVDENRQKAVESGISIRRVETVSDCQDCESVQLRAWGNIPPVPVHMIHALSDNGGLVMNAYDKAGRPIGTNISFLGKYQTKSILYSHMTGVVPEYQSKGVGLLLKIKQRDYALDQGFDLVCWTYDPMQSPNNWFNLNKLGTVSKAYYPNYYGNMPDQVNRGLESDRILAEWWIRSPRVELRTKTRTNQTENTQRPRIANEAVLKDGILQPADHPNLSLDDEDILIEIPYSYAQVRSVDPAILRAWRAETRQLYSHYFGLGYFATAALITKGEHSRSFVRMESRPLERILQS
jgi:predicted GNAT superfamily acetyltransferase